MGVVMDASELVGDLRAAITDLEAKGGSTIPVASLRDYLDLWEEDASKAAKLNVDEAVHQRTLHLEQFKHHMSANAVLLTEMFKSVLEAGPTALRAVTVINGGAAAAILAFIGGVLKPGGSADALVAVSPLGAAWFMFMIGLGAAGTAAGFRYLAQACYQRALERDIYKEGSPLWNRAANIITVVSTLVGISALVFFFVGSWKLARLFGAM